jgi:hypothetical protein
VDRIQILVEVGFVITCALDKTWEEEKAEQIAKRLMSVFVVSVTSSTLGQMREQCLKPWTLARLM